MNQQKEKLLVLLPCLKKCKWLLQQGSILEYKRLDAFDYQHIDGSPDIEVRIIKDNIVWLLMFEAKKPGGGVHLDSQKEYRDKYQSAHNVVYALVESVKEMEAIIEKYTEFYQRKLDGIEAEF